MSHMSSAGRPPQAKRWPLVFFLALLLAGLPGPPAGEAAGPGWPHEASDLAPDPEVTFGRLPNGFRYVLMPNRTPRGRVSMHLNIQSGSLQENDAQQGLAHFWSTCCSTAPPISRPESW
jgi:hypothetical protein